MSQRVLIVEDEVIVADDLDWELTKLGYQVVGTAGSGEEAVVVARRERPDIVLVDIQLQGKMLGTEAARLIQRETGSAIIFLTAFATVFGREPERAMPLGVCLSKPYSPAQLKNALQSLQSDNQRN